MADDIKDVEFITKFDGSKMFRVNAEWDFRTGNINAANLLNFAPYKSGYCFLAVMATPKFMRADGFGDSSEAVSKELDNRRSILNTFVDILELEFLGLSGIEDGSLETNDVSNNVQNVSVIYKNSRNINSNVSMSFTEKSGTPITTFLDLYSRYLSDPYCNAKTYGGRLNTDQDYIKLVKKNNAISHHNTLKNETFELLYAVTDDSCLLVEKAFILHNAQPLNVPYSIFDNTKFDIDKKEISINWKCLAIDGPLANKLATVYVRNLILSCYENDLFRTVNGDTKFDPLDRALGGGRSVAEAAILSGRDVI